jgi:hypothetical protein
MTAASVADTAPDSTRGRDAFKTPYAAHSAADAALSSSIACDTSPLLPVRSAFAIWGAMVAHDATVAA